VLVPRGVPVLEAALWAVFTSLPQPLMALPAFLSVQARWGRGGGTVPLSLRQHWVGRQCVPGVVAGAPTPNPPARVQSFALALPAGLGFAAGAMAWVAAAELLVEAAEGLGPRSAALCAAAAALPMLLFHVLAREE